MRPRREHVLRQESNGRVASMICEGKDASGREKNGERWGLEVRCPRCVGNATTQASGSRRLRAQGISENVHKRERTIKKTRPTRLLNLPVSWCQPSMRGYAAAGSSFERETKLRSPRVQSLWRTSMQEPDPLSKNIQEGLRREVKPESKRHQATRHA